MTSKERVIKAINHEKTDKIPVDLGSTLVTGTHVYSYNELKKFLQVTSGNIEIIDTNQLLAKVEDEIIERLMIDAVPLLGAYDPLGVSNLGGLKEWVMPNGLSCFVSKDFNPIKQSDGSHLIEKNGSIFKMPRNGFYFDAIKLNLCDAESFQDIEKRFNFSGFGKKEVEYYKKEASRLKNSSKAVIGEMFFNFEIEFFLGYEKALMNLILKKNMMNEFLERLTEMYIKNFCLFEKAVGDVADIVILYKDLGNQNGPPISPKMVREIFIPYMKKLVTYIKENSNYYVMLHACGSIYEFIPDIIDCGFDILNPVQINAKNMEPDKLKSEFGKYLCFWGGGVDTQRVLPFGSEEEVRSQVRENTKIFSKNGGFVFNPVHNIQANIPPQNIMAAFNEVNSFSFI